MFFIGVGLLLNKLKILVYFSPRRDLNNFIIRFFLSIYSYPFFGDYIIRQCYKIVINELFEGKRNTVDKNHN